MICMSSPLHIQAVQVRRFFVLAAVIGLCCLCGPGMAAQSPVRDMADMSISEEEHLETFLAQRRRMAARYILDRQRALPSLSDDHHARALRIAQEARDAFAQGHVSQALSMVRHGLKRYPYSDAAPILTHMAFRANAVAANFGRARRHLIDLRERFPEYPDIGVAMEEALVVAETAQSQGRVIDLDAAAPRDVVSVSDVGSLRASNMFFYYLTRYGDRHHVAPRATLGLARAHLIQGQSRFEKLFDARRHYELFFDRFPQHPLVFEALCEYALSYLIAYRGDVYDLGVIVTAESIIERQARHYTGEDPVNIARIEQYRSLIRRWWQDRDLRVGRWYQARRQDDAAALYYREVIARDSSSAQAQEARRRLAAVTRDR